MLSRTIKRYCQKHAITFAYEGPDVQFLAPAGKVFSTEAPSRFFEEYDEMPTAEMLDHLHLEVAK